MVAVDFYRGDRTASGPVTASAHALAANLH